MPAAQIGQAINKTPKQAFKTTKYFIRKIEGLLFLSKINVRTSPDWERLSAHCGNKNASYHAVEIEDILPLKLLSRPTS